jgi:Flp pilus assembly protein TadG
VRSRSTETRRRRRPDGGSVTAETALALPAVVLVLATLLGVGQALLARISCVDAARAGARAAARAEPDAQVRLKARRLVPAAAVAVSRVGGVVRVEVTAATRVVPSIAAVQLRCVAVAAAEEP